MQLSHLTTLFSTFVAFFGGLISKVYAVCWPCRKKAGENDADHMFDSNNRGI